MRTDETRFDFRIPASTSAFARMFLTAHGPSDGTAPKTTADSMDRHTPPASAKTPSAAALDRAETMSAFTECPTSAVRPFWNDRAMSEHKDGAVIGYARVSTGKQGTSRCNSTRSTRSAAPACSPTRRPGRCAPGLTSRSAWTTRTTANWTQLLGSVTPGAKYGQPARWIAR